MLCNQRLHISTKRLGERDASPQLKRARVQPFSDANVLASPSIEPRSKDSSSDTPATPRYIHIQYLECFNLAFEVRVQQTYQLARLQVQHLPSPRSRRLSPGLDELPHALADPLLRRRVGPVRAEALRSLRRALHPSPELLSVRGQAPVHLRQAADADRTGRTLPPLLSRRSPSTRRAPSFSRKTWTGRTSSGGWSGSASTNASSTFAIWCSTPTRSAVVCSQT